MNGATNSYILINPKPKTTFKVKHRKTPNPYAQRVKTLSYNNAQNIDQQPDAKKMTLNKLSNKRYQPQTIIPNILGKPMFEHIISKNTVVSHKSRK